MKLLPINIMDTFSNPVLLASVETGKQVISQSTKDMVTANVTSGHFIYDMIITYIMPFIWDVGKVLLTIGIIRGIYMLMNSDVKGFVNKTKWATSGYVLLRFIKIFTTLIDSMADGLVAQMIGGQ